jgi:hypothetical protein
MSTKQTVLSRQSAWAARAGLALDANGYLPSWQENLFRPLSPHALASFEGGSGNELKDTGRRSAKMRATHSSSALVANVFDYWTGSPDRVLASLGLPLGADSFSFEAQFPTGLEGKPPNLDICVRRTNEALVGVESKFSEWLTAKSAQKEHFKPKYFPPDRKLWAAFGLRGAQQLAETVHARQTHFRFLDVPQLLKHALGLANTLQPFELYYLYFDVDGREADVHRAEIREFAQAVSGDFPFHVGTYQEVYSRVRQQATACDTAYLSYLDARYFS